MLNVGLTDSSIYAHIDVQVLDGLELGIQVKKGCMADLKVMLTISDVTLLKAAF